MSVINKVLQDLEKRGVAQNGHSGMGETGTEVRSVSARGTYSGGKRLVLILLAALPVAWLLPQMLSGYFVRGLPAPIESRTGEKSAAITAVLKTPEPSAAAPAEISAVSVPSKITQPVVAPSEKAVNDILASFPSLKLSELPAQRITDKPLAHKPLIGKLPPPSVPGGKPLALPEKAMPAATRETEAGKEIKQISPQQRAEHEFQKAVALMQQGRVNEALEAYAALLKQHPAHDAGRQTLVGLLLEQGRSSEAERVLREGLAVHPDNIAFAMMLARIEVERGATAAAIQTLQKNLPHAVRHADYLAFLAALLQRETRHEQAIEQYQNALKLSPAAGVWWMGLGISLQAEGRLSEASEAYVRAKSSESLTPELQAFVNQRLKQTRLP